ncbi:MAG: Maf family protein [Candidatus Sericytochromatia bacterium]
MNIILASASPRRKELLELINLSFTIQSSNIDEIIDETLSLEKKIEKLSYQKAYDISLKNKGNNLIIGADTIVELNNEILGKPKDKNDASRMLNLLSGKEHNVITAITLIDTSNDKFISTHEKTKVKFIELNQDKINKYIDSGEPMDKAGAYAIQGLGVMFVKSISGCYTNVVGLPIPLLTNILEKEFNIKPL